MNQYLERVPCYVINDRTGAVEAISARLGRSVAVRRKIRPSHGKNLTGRVPITYLQSAGLGGDGGGGGHGGGRTASVQYESGLERDFLLWIREFPGLVDVRAQPLTVPGYIDGVRREYTPDYAVEFATVPAELRELGFETFTFVEIKPECFVNREVLMKLCMLQLNTGVASVLVTDDTISAALAA